jgi:ribosome maturation factor RimP
METSQHHVIAGVDLDRVQAAIGPVLSANGVELWDLEFLTERAGWTLRVVIERRGALENDATGGVSLEDCSDVSHDVSSVLDVEDLIPHRYHLEVSSPGLDRVLRRESDFLRFLGKSARVKLGKPAPDGQRVLRGRLDPAPPGAIAVIVDGKRIEAPFADVEEANLVFELTPQPKKAVAKGKASRAKHSASKR